MKLRRFVLPLATLVLSLAVSHAQAAKPELSGFEVVSRGCATPEPSMREMESVKIQVDRWLGMNTINAVGGQIKVAFHVIHSGKEGNLTDAQINGQIAELNKAYSGFYGGANTGYTFVLASVDRTRNTKWFRLTPGSASELEAKQALAIDVPHRLNIYSCKPGQNLLGWAYFPSSYPEGDYRHGVVIHYASIPGGALAPYNLGGTADHEVGHYLGLYHTFQGGCSAPGDYVDDTPYEGSATSGCPNNKDTCPSAGVDPIHNYMDYSTDACYTQFTSGQDARMDAIVPAYRPSLLNAAVATLAGSRPLTGVSASGVQFRGAFPNPFRSETNVAFALPRASHVSLRVYNVAGQHVATLADGEMAAGEQSIAFRGQGLPTGTYFLSLKVGGIQLSRSVILVR
jgi:hypothetical protein